MKIKGKKRPISSSDQTRPRWRVGRRRMWRQTAQHKLPKRRVENTSREERAESITSDEKKAIKEGRIRRLEG